MVKVITQETFDAVVEENMEEFEMDRPEAVRDATEQFKQQGVNLSNIVISEEGSQVVVNAVNMLFKDLNTTELENQMKIVSDCCKDNLAQRVLATKNGAYSVLVRLLKKDDTKMMAASTLAIVMDTNPDNLDNQGRERMVELFQDQDEDVVNAGLDWLLVCCVRHEENRQAVVAQQGLLHSLTKLAGNKSHVAGVGRVWMALVQDDDVRVPFGKAHEHAREIVETHGALSVLTSHLASGDHLEREVVNICLNTLATLSVRNEYCQEVVDKGGLTVLLNILTANKSDCEMVTKSLLLLKVLSGNDIVKDDVGKLGGIPLILSAIQHHILKPGTCETGCKAVASICLRQNDNCIQVIDNEGAAVITTLMEQHPKHERVQGAAAAAIRNIVSREKDLSSGFIERGVEELLSLALDNHGDRIGDTLRSALRDLGLKVQMQEHWTGAKVNIKKDFRETEQIED